MQDKANEYLNFLPTEKDLNAFVKLKGVHSLDSPTPHTPVFLKGEGEQILITSLGGNLKN